jgi:hypothetical protein
MATQTGAPDLTSLYNTPEMTGLANTAASTSATATAYQSAASQLPEKLKQAILAKLQYNQDIINEKNAAQAKYFAAPATARAQYQDITNPFDREALVAQATGNAYTPYANLTDILSQRMGSISDAINAGTGAFGSAVTAEQGAATTAQNAYSTALSLADRLASAIQWKYQQDNPGVGTAGYGQAQIQAAQKDAQNQMTLQDMLKKYTGLGLDPNTIYTIYNQYNYGTDTAKGGAFQPGKGGYGSAKQTAAQLQAWGIDRKSTRLNSSHVP